MLSNKKNSLKKRNAVEVIIPKEEHDLEDIFDAPFKMLELAKTNDEKIFAYRECEIKLLTQIYAELKMLNQNFASFTSTGKEK